MKLVLEGQEVTDYLAKDDIIENLTRKANFAEALAQSLTQELTVNTEVLEEIVDTVFNYYEYSKEIGFNYGIDLKSDLSETTVNMIKGIKTNAVNSNSNIQK